MISILVIISRISPLVETLHVFWLQELGSLQEYLLALNTEDHLHRCTAQVGLHSLAGSGIFVADTERFLIAHGVYKRHTHVLGHYSTLTGL